MLESTGTKVVYNNLSDQLRKDIEDKAAEAGRFIKYKFDIARKNPDVEMRVGGEYLYPLLYSLSPVTFDIIDPYDKKRKKIGLVKQLKEFGAVDNSFYRVQVNEWDRGILRLDMNKAEDRDKFAYLELHPKLSGGAFQDANSYVVVSKIDDVKAARKSLGEKEGRANAMFVATSMTVSEVKDFACAMGWDEHEDIDILRDRVLDIADKTPDFFKDFINNKQIEYRAVIKRAMDNNVIQFQPVENKFVWGSNGQTIAVLERCEGGIEEILQRMCDWILTSKNGNDVYARLKGILKVPSSAT